jgi:pyruvate/2-oxoglutarate/acetoin dehydrogenase E1 component
MNQNIPMLAPANEYSSELTRAMAWLGAKPETLFLGQAVSYPGTAMTATLADVQREKLLELPVMEDAQLGMCIGLAIDGFVPVSIYPRWNFLLLATNQLVLHLDKLSIYSNGGYKPKVIIRTAVASRMPLDPQAQHYGDFSEAYRKMLRTVEVIELDSAEMIFPAYRKAYEREDGRSTLIVERTDRYAT